MLREKKRRLYVGQIILAILYSMFVYILIWSGGQLVIMILKDDINSLNVPEWVFYVLAVIQGVLPIFIVKLTVFEAVTDMEAALKKVKLMLKNPLFWKVQRFNCGILICTISRWLGRLGAMWTVFILCKAVAFSSFNEIDMSGITGKLFYCLFSLLFFFEIGNVLKKSLFGENISRSLWAFVNLLIVMPMVLAPSPESIESVFVPIAVGSVVVSFLSTIIKKNAKAKMVSKLLPTCDPRSVKIVYDGDLAKLMTHHEFYFPVSEDLGPDSYILGMSYTQNSLVCTRLDSDGTEGESKVRTMGRSGYSHFHLDLQLSYSPVRLSAEILVNRYYDSDDSFPEFFSKFKRQKKIVKFNSVPDVEACELKYLPERLMGKRVEQEIK